MDPVDIIPSVNGVALSARVHPEATTTALGLRTVGAEATAGVRAWRMADAWPADRR